MRIPRRFTHSRARRSRPRPKLCGLAIVEKAPVSTGREAKVTEAGDYRLFAGWRSDPFFCDVEGTKNNLQFTGDDYKTKNKKGITRRQK